MRLKAVFVLATCLGIGCAPCMLWAQQTPASDAKLVFEVASVKVNKSGDRRSSMRWQPGGRFVAVNLPLSSLVSIAYAVPLYQLDNLPSWVGSARFDITAQAKREPALDERPALLRTLLQDRFHVLTRTEVVEKEIYVLVMARPDRRLGPGLRSSSVQCSTSPDAAPQLPVTPGTRPKCAAILGIGSIAGDGLQLSTLTGMLGAQLQRVVVDRTGLSGRFDMDLTSSATDEQPSVFTALQEQLGLKLESQRGPVSVTVFERIEMPTEN